MEMKDSISPTNTEEPKAEQKTARTALWLVAAFAVVTVALSFLLLGLMREIQELRHERLEYQTWAEQAWVQQNANAQHGSQQESAADESADVLPGVSFDDLDSHGFVEIESNLEGAVTYVCVAQDMARCYRYADASSEVIGKFENGDKVDVLRAEGSFYLCFSDGQYGYVEARYLSRGGTLADIPDAVDLREYLPEAQFELLFASENNITGEPLYAPVPILEKHTAEMLLEAYNIFRADGYTIKIYDAYRPRSAQFALYDAVQDSRFIANPYVGYSWHQLGRAVDMSLVNIETGEELEMPTPMHTFNISAARTMSESWNYFASANVDYMTSVMESVGFGIISTEWWHFENASGAGGYLDPNIDLSALA